MKKKKKRPSNSERFFDRLRPKKKSEIHLFIREKMLTIFGWNFEIWAVQKYVNLVDLVKSFPTSIYLQKSASIQPRTSLSKFGGKFNSLFIRLLSSTSYGADACMSRLSHVTLPTAAPSPAPTPEAPMSGGSWGARLAVNRPLRSWCRGIVKRSVLGCIDADFCVQIRIFQHFSRSTRFKTLCTTRNRLT